MALERLEATEGTSGYIDETVKIAYVTFGEIVSPTVTAAVYAWGFRLGNIINPSEYATIYDFQQVKEYNPGTLSSVQRSSQQINQKQDWSKHPIALVVKTLYQEKMVKVVMQITQQPERKRIVKTMDEAHEFIRQYRARNSVSTPPATEKHSE